MKPPDKPDDVKSEREDVRRVLKSWNKFIRNMKTKGALISHSHGQTKIKI